MSSETPGALPVPPYKGLLSYTEADAALFAGRDADIRACASALADWNTRILVLHGMTGCGKSSLLRAGVIPHLEQKGTGLKFARPGHARDVFITSTADPLAKLANALFHFVYSDIVVETPIGPRTLDLKSALPKPAEQDVATFVRTMSKDPSSLLSILEKLSLIVPETLILIIDQGEEVLTLSPGPNESRDLFFEFLSRFANVQFDMKILVALRTEYLGRFVSHLRLGFRGSGISDYYLGEMTTQQVEEALSRPASIGDEQSRFTFEPGVVVTAIGQLDHAPLGRLGALQIAFTELYALMDSRPGPRIITHADLTELGNVEGSIERFVTKALLGLGMLRGLTPVNAVHESTVWMEALCHLLRFQPDGTVTTDLKRVDELRSRLANSRLEFDSTAEALLQAGLLKVVNVIGAQGNLIRCFGIGHDTVGQVLWNWKRRRDQQSKLSPVATSADEPEEGQSSPDRDIALCLSGGGYRAMLFNLGAVWRLNELGYLPQLGRVSSVAGGAVLAGVLAMRWNEFSLREGVALNFASVIADPLLEFAGRTIDTKDVLIGLLPGLNPADRMSRDLDALLFEGRTLQDMPDQPSFVFSATNLQKVSQFRFSKAFIGDATIGTISRHPLKLATAVAASNALPPVLSPLILDLKAANWTTVEPVPREFRDRVYLASGSVIDNLGLEAAWRRHQTILVCDGGVDSPDSAEPETDWISQSLRTVAVIDQQLRNLRRRQVIEAYTSQKKKGAYWSIKSVLENTRYELRFDRKRASELEAIATRFAKLDEATRHDLVNLGYAVCDAVLAKDFNGKSSLQAFAFPFPERGIGVRRG